MYKRQDYDNLTAIGSMMGSGGLIVMDEDTCMVDLAKFFLEFTVDESCGKCSPCRIGTRRMLEILTRITEGNGTLEDLDELEEIAATLKTNSLCALGQTAANPVLSTLKHFRDEYLAHIDVYKRQALRCIGACGIAPAVTINGKVYPKVTVDMVPGIVEEYRAAAQ